MDQSPTQAAAAEQAQREAAFQRARAKLAAARLPEEQRRNYGRAIFAALRVGGWFVIGAAVVGVLAWQKPEVFDPATWQSEPILPVALGFMLVLILGGVLLRRLKKRVPPAAKAIRDFYEAANGEERLLYRRVIRADLDDAERRAPGFENGIILPQRLDSAKALHQYWRDLFKPGFALRYEAKVRGVSLTPVADDLALAHVKLRVYRFSWILAMIVIAVVAVSWTLAHDYLDRTPWHFPALASLLLAAFAAFNVLPRIRKADFNIRKLVVRCGEEWRLFCGDREGWEEADLSWLDEQEPRA